MITKQTAIYIGAAVASAAVLVGGYLYFKTDEDKTEKHQLDAILTEMELGYVELTAKLDKAKKEEYKNALGALFDKFKAQIEAIEFNDDTMRKEAHSRNERLFNKHNLS